ncbi:hypothetical protein FHR56_000239 [Xanthomonas sacchari]|uniref:alanine acetyltransferase n=1 Tax=unclassified Xanthomonas TaxID=2643310 RepID=UPI00136FC635|nr:MULTISPECIES: alanine acetyltransferase [unclassified Xanthomonas]MBB6365126.1 hypothetical protein [Xanthomonas sp. F10]MXV34491.1 alanine acetyltransferase [Xanthomonas sp. LMG 8989]
MSEHASGHAPLWSAEQVGWLQALGHTVYVDAAAVVEPEPAPSPAIEPAAPVQRSAAGSAPPRGGYADAPATEAPERRRASAPPAPTVQPDAVRAAPAAGARRVGLRLPDRLQIALLRASGLNPNDPATQALMATWPLDELRGNAAAKRALWPQLRALRKRVPR